MYIFHQNDATIPIPSFVEMCQYFEFVKTYLSNIHTYHYRIMQLIIKIINWNLACHFLLEVFAQNAQIKSIMEMTPSCF